MKFMICSLLFLLIFITLSRERGEGWAHNERMWAFFQFQVFNLEEFFMWDDDFSHLSCWNDIFNQVKNTVRWKKVYKFAGSDDDSIKNVHLLTFTAALVKGYSQYYSLMFLHLLKALLIRNYFLSLNKIIIGLFSILSIDNRYKSVLSLFCQSRNT